MGDLQHFYAENNNDFLMCLIVYLKHHIRFYAVPNNDEVY